MSLDNEKQPSIEKLEERLTALALGEATPLEAEELRRLMEKDPKLALWHAQLEKTVQLVREASKDASSESISATVKPKLSEKRREMLRTAFKKPALDGSQAPEFASRRKEIPWFVTLGMAAGIVALLSALLFMDRSPFSKGHAAFLIEESQLDLAARQPVARNSGLGANGAATSPGGESSVRTITLNVAPQGEDRKERAVDRGIVSNLRQVENVEERLRRIDPVTGQPLPPPSPPHEPLLSVTRTLGDVAEGLEVIGDKDGINYNERTGQILARGTQEDLDTVGLVKALTASIQNEEKNKSAAPDQSPSHSVQSPRGIIEERAAARPAISAIPVNNALTLAVRPERGNGQVSGFEAVPQTQGKPERGANVPSQVAATKPAIGRENSISGVEAEAQGSRLAERGLAQAPSGPEANGRVGAQAGTAGSRQRGFEVAAGIVAGQSQMQSERGRNRLGFDRDSLARSDSESELRNSPTDENRRAPRPELDGSARFGIAAVQDKQGGTPQGITGIVSNGTTVDSLALIDQSIKPNAETESLRESLGRTQTAEPDRLSAVTASSSRGELPQVALRIEGTAIQTENLKAIERQLSEVGDESAPAKPTPDSKLVEQQSASSFYRMDPKLLERYGLLPAASARARETEALTEESIARSKKLADLESSVEKKPEPQAKPQPTSGPAPKPQPEVLTRENRFSTFSLNVSDVSFKLAESALERGVFPEPNSVRTEEFINAFDYHDTEPPPGVPLGFTWERAQYPFAHNRDILRLSIRTAAFGREAGRPLNLVILLDNSGSMERPDRVATVRAALTVLAGMLQAQDQISVIAFARTPRLWIDGMQGGNPDALLGRLLQLVPDGGTNLEAALELAYQTAGKHFVPGGNNRVVLMTDGAANLGNVNTGELKETVTSFRKQGIALDCFGIGWDGYNDPLLEALSRNGDGRYGFLNKPEEASGRFAKQLAGALQVAASDVKVQVEFNPERVVAFRQIGYAKHQLKKEEFRDNTVDAAEIGAAESGNALYAIETNANGKGPIGVVRVRFKRPSTGEIEEREWPVPDGPAAPLDQANPSLRLAVTASAFGEWLARSPYASEVRTTPLLSYLSGVPEAFPMDPRPKVLESMIRQAGAIAGE